MSFMDSSFFQIITAGLLSTLLFAALIIYISKNPQKGANPLKVTFIVMFIGGMAIYCTCHYLGLKYAIEGQIKSGSLEWAKAEDSPWLHVAYIMMRSVMDVGMMFSGRNNSGVFYALPESKNPTFVLIFWLVHMIAFYTVASTLLVRFGNALIQWIRLATTKVSDVDLVFGINSNSLAAGRNIEGIKGRMLVYVDSRVGESYLAPIRDLEGFIYSNKEALKAAPSFLKMLRVKPGKMMFRLYVLSEDYDRNLQYAQRTLESLKTLKIDPEQTELVLLGTDEWKGMDFQSKEERYGYGDVLSCNEFEMASRLLISTYPLCDAIDFDESGRAMEEMDALIVGFGRMGQEVLRKIVANGQFETGSHKAPTGEGDFKYSNFHAAVFDPDFERRLGFIKSECPRMFAYYDIKFYPQDGRSGEIFQFINENAAKLKYIVVCLEEDRETARDIAMRLVDRLNTLGYSRKVYTCDINGIRCYSRNARECENHGVYDSATLYSREPDRYAMELNHRYAGGSDAKEDWKRCDYVHRMSCRASVDYLTPLLRRVGHGALTPEQRENLAKSEHLRWCAFRYSFGFNERLADWDELDETPQVECPMPREEQASKNYARGKVDAVMELMLDAEHSAT